MSDLPATPNSAPAYGAPPPAPAAIEPPPPAALLPALAAFDAGDFRTTRALLGALLAAAPAPEVEKEARRLRRRLAPDPWARRFGLLALALLVGLGIIYLR